MIERVLGHLAAHGIDQAVLSLGYRPDSFLAAYPDGKAAGVKITYAIEPELLDTAGAIRFAARTAAIDETFVAVNGDVLTDGDVSALISFHESSGAEATIYLSPVQDPSRFGVVPTGLDGRVLEFVEKPPPGQAPTNLINAGIYVMEPRVLDRIPEGRRVSVERETFPALASEGVLFALSDGAYWLDTGTPEAYLRAQRDLLELTRGEPPTPGATRATPATSTGPGAWVLGRPEISGSVDRFSLVADGAQVCPGAVVERSVLGPHCIVEPGTRVEGSVLLAATRVMQDAIVSASIVGHRCVIGKGASVAELSILGDDVSVGDLAEVVSGRLRATLAKPS